MFYFRSLMVLMVVSLVLLGVHACKKENQAPTLTIDKPITNQAVSTSDSVLITGVIADDKDLHELYITVVNTQGDTAMHVNPYVHGLKNKTYSVYFAPADTGTYTATVTVVDHDLEFTQQSVTFVAYNAAVLNLLLPIDNSAVPLNWQLQVKGNVSDDVGLLYLSFVSVNARSGDTVNEQTVLLNNSTSYTFDNFVSQTDTGTLNLIVTAVNNYSFATSKTVKYIVY